MRLLSFFAITLVVTACANKPVTEEPKVDAKWVESVSRDHNHEVLKCYEDALKVDKKIAGDLQLELNATAVGSVSAVKVEKPVAAVLDACVKARAMTWIYPWIKKETPAIQEHYRLYLNESGNPISEYSGPAMDKDVVRDTVRGHLPEVAKCYTDKLKRMPNLQGKLVLTWDILGSGEVTNVAVKQSVEPTVDKCVASKLAKWKFPSPPNNVVAKVSYPFQFAPATAK